MEKLAELHAKAQQKAAFEKKLAEEIKKAATKAKVSGQKPPANPMAKRAAAVAKKGGKGKKK